jgi:serine-type D-Ala-D-Ala carboxypeptidase/endopeptidase (penicillin-binding protein 4)
MHRFKLIFSATFLIFIAACAPTRYAEKGFGKKLHRQIEQSTVFSGAFTGFVLLDPVTGKTLCDVNGGRHFTPASNTKILTLYTSLKVLGDSMPGARLLEEEGAWSVFPTGDPTFLNPLFAHWQPVFKVLKNSPLKKINLWDAAPTDHPLGSGWCWDDANTEYSAERSAFPMYGNVKRIYLAGKDSLVVEPSFWQAKMGQTTQLRHQIELLEQEPDNSIFYRPLNEFPARYEEILAIRNVKFESKNLLEDTLKKEVDWFHYLPANQKQGRLMYSTPVDTVFRRLMHQSDNFVAEQLLLVCAGQKYGAMKQDSIIQYAKKNLLADLPNPPKWVDGSGLSRYNLMTPHFLAALLQKMWKEYPQPRLFSFFPAGGVSGTIGNWYKGADGKPYVFAKTGSMSGVHCLSGYLVAKSGKTLVFSFMHNNFTGGSKAWKEEMQRVLEQIRARY